MKYPEEQGAKYGMTKFFYRPRWTCGKYNKEKHVAIMYNLLHGYSFFFESFSADVIGIILQTKRDGKLVPSNISEQTGITEDSIIPFLEILEQNGLVTSYKPKEKDIDRLRFVISEQRKIQPAWVDKPTSEKLPMWTSNAEQLYFDAVDNGTTVCSCLLELTYRCSEACVHCYNPGATRNSEEASHRGDCKELSLSDYKKLIDQFIELGLVKVCLSGGDPFSKEITWGIIDYLYEKEIAIDIFTNGQRIINDVKRLANYFPRLVGVSIYSGIAEDHDAITRVPGSWQRSMSVVKELSDFAVPMNLKCCVMQPNLHSYYMVADIARKYGAQPQFELNITESNDGDICAKQLRLTEKQLEIVLRDSNIPLYVGKEAPNYGGQKRDLSQCSCGAGGTGFCLSPDGKLRGCPAFSQIYGDVLKQNVLEILSKSKPLKEWRKAVVQDYTECGRHEFCDYCNLCAGVNYTEHGDFRKPAETNCYMAKCRYNLAKRLMEQDEESLAKEEFVAALKQLPKAKVVLKRSYHTKG